MPKIRMTGSALICKQTDFRKLRDCFSIPLLTLRDRLSQKSWELNPRDNLYAKRDTSSECRGEIWWQKSMIAGLKTSVKMMPSLKPSEFGSWSGANM